MRRGVLLGAAVPELTLPPAGLATSRSLTTPRMAPGIAKLADFRAADFGDHAAFADARYVANWVAHSEENQRLPFVIFDKRNALVFVFDAGGMLIDASPVLLGAAACDDSVMGIGQRSIVEVRSEKRTTPAGRFVSRPGRNASGEDVV